MYVFMYTPHPVKIDLDKKLDSKQRTIQAFNIVAHGFRKARNENPNHGQISWHWLAGISYFPCRRIFISSFSEPLDINVEGLNSLLLGI